MHRQGRRTGNSRANLAHRLMGNPVRTRALRSHYRRYRESRDGDQLSAARACITNRRTPNRRPGLAPGSHCSRSWTMVTKQHRQSCMRRHPRILWRREHSSMGMVVSMLNCQGAKRTRHDIKAHQEATRPIRRPTSGVTFETGQIRQHIDGAMECSTLTCCVTARKNAPEYSCVME